MALILKKSGIKDPAKFGTELILEINKLLKAHSEAEEKTNLITIFNKLLETSSKLKDDTNAIIGVLNTMPDFLTATSVVIKMLNAGSSVTDIVGVFTRISNHKDDQDTYLLGLDYEDDLDTVSANKFIDSMQESEENDEQEDEQNEQENEQNEQENEQNDEDEQNEQDDEQNDEDEQNEQDDEQNDEDDQDDQDDEQTEQEDEQNEQEDEQNEQEDEQNEQEDEQNEQEDEQNEQEDEQNEQEDEEKYDKLLELWNLSIELGNIVRAEVFNGNTKLGLEAWQAIKSDLPESTTAIQWKLDPKDKIEIIEEDESKSPQPIKINGVNLNNKKELHHFLIQHYRIPLLNKLSLRRLAQVAYNIGQLQDAIKKTETIDFQFRRAYKNYEELKLNKIETFVDAHKYANALSEKDLNTAISAVQKEIKNLRSDDDEILSSEDFIGIIESLHYANGKLFEGHEEFTENYRLENFKHGLLVLDYGSEIYPVPIKLVTLDLDSIKSNVHKMLKQLKKPEVTVMFKEAIIAGRVCTLIIY